MWWSVFHVFLRRFLVCHILIMKSNFTSHIINYMKNNIYTHIHIKLVISKPKSTTTTQTDKPGVYKVLQPEISQYILKTTKKSLYVWLWRSTMKQHKMDITILRLVDQICRFNNQNIYLQPQKHWKTQLKSKRKQIH